MDLEPASVNRIGGRRGVVEALHELASRGGDAVLAVVVATSGSTYRKPGALILLDADGVRVGALSGGCLEVELETRASAVLASGCAADVRFDTSGDEDRVFGSGSGCGGSTQVLLLPIPARVSPLRDALLDAQAAGAGLTLTLVAAGTQLGGGVAIVATHAPARRYAFDHRGAAADVSSIDGASVHVTIARTPRLLLLGAGPETPPLLQLSRLLGWQVELAEHRERWLRYAAGSGFDRVHRDGPDALAELLQRERFDAALVMHHNFHLDARGLAFLAASRVGYIGLLGPAARRDDLLREIGAEVADALGARLNAPVGLPLGGEGAEAIALAIAAQLQTRFAQHARA
jgi:xanthine dehydrogenase accessory factor